MNFFGGIQRHIKMVLQQQLKLCVVAAVASTVAGFHDCIQHPSHASLSGRVRIPGAPPVPCAGGLCVGMHGGPHEGGPASYPVGDATKGYTSVRSTMTVPELPKKQDGICYYIWFVFLDRGRLTMQYMPLLKHFLFPIQNGIAFAHLATFCSPTPKSKAWPLTIPTIHDPSVTSRTDIFFGDMSLGKMNQFVPRTYAPAHCPLITVSKRQ